MAIYNFLVAKDGLCMANRRALLLLFYTACYAAYIALGGLCFLLIEGPQEEVQRKNIAAARASFVKKHPCVNEDVLNEFLNEASSFRIRSLNAPNATARWTYSEAVFFSVTLLTTIGYGHIVPVSAVGKAVCMMYTGIGIPMTLMLLAAYVQRLMRGAEALRRFLNRCLDETLKPFVIRLIHLATIIVLIILIFFLLPAVLFSYLEEGWTFLDGLYFCFISLTTVGLGDYVPGLGPNQPYGTVYRLGVTFYVLAGITTMMFMMALTADFQQSLSRHNQESLPRTYQDEKIPITLGNNTNLESYGSLIIHSKKIIDDDGKKEITQP